MTLCKIVQRFPDEAGRELIRINTVESMEGVTQFDVLPETQMLFGAIAASAVGWGSARMTRSMKTSFKTGYDSVRDLARFLVASYPQLSGKPRTAKWTEEEISCLLREVIIQQLGVNDFDDNSRFVQDLHID